MEVPAWTPSIVLDGVSLPSDASIRDFQQGKAGYIANAVEKALLLPSDMAYLKSIRKHEVFLSLKRDLAMVSPSPNPLYIYIYIFKLYNPLPFSSIFFYYVSFLVGCSSHK